MKTINVTPKTAYYVGQINAYDTGRLSMTGKSVKLRIPGVSNLVDKLRKKKEEDVDPLEDIQTINVGGSSNVDKIYYAPDVKILQVRFLNGAVYQYENVPASVWAGMVQASSKGKYMWSHIRDHYKYSKIKALLLY